jgi:ABC-type antimicrobial peptide transport system permease subunit
MFNSTNSVEQNRFSSSDETTVSSLDHVLSAKLQTTLPVNNIETTDLFDGKTVSLNSLTTMDSTAASLYTTDDFTYTTGQAIPIILNSSSLVSSSEDWSSGTTITITESSPSSSSSTSRQPGESPMQRLSFLKSTAIDYNKDTLVGTKFTLQIGNLDAIQDYTISRSSGTTVITKLTDDELATKVSARETAISEYWDYNKISTPLTYTFVVVGVIDDSSVGSSTAYIPENFADTLMSDYISHEINARNGTTIPTDVLNSTFTGVTYDGTELTTSTNGMMGQFVRRMEQRSSSSTSSTTEKPADDGGFGSFGTTGYLIPGLVIQVDSSNNVTGTISDSSIYTNSTKYSDILNVVIDSAANRSAVVSELNTAGYAYQDSNDVGVFDKLQSTLNTISNIFLISFIVLVSAIVAFTMSKFISESIKEIGIFRAIGMRKSSVLTMFISQSLLYVLIGYIGGLALGIGLNFLAGHFVSVWFASFLKDTVSKTFNVVNTVGSSAFFGINWSSIALYTALLIAISSIISVITSLSASKVSPVEAIKNE